MLSRPQQNETRFAMKTSSLKKLPAAKAKRAAVRFGRPPKELAGEVDARILDAAHKVFLERGFEGASIEEIAEVARSGKPTIYARFRNKRALFTAVVKRDILSRITEFKSEVPTGATTEERFRSAAITLLRWGFDGDRIALMRLAVAEARRFPDLAATASRTARELSTEIGIHLLKDLTQSNELKSLPAFAPERLATTARLFLDIVAVPMLLRALFEVNLKTLDAEIDAHVARSVAFFLAACRNSGVESDKP
ncbi:MAG TPA: TetR/AcrR family transcriptional regulator [Pseudolabrys sp.]|jgi:AcrR family transcriptional regulator